MKFFNKSLTVLGLALTFNMANAKDCENSYGKYGGDIMYQNIGCRFFISADSVDSNTNRNVTVTDEGMIQVFSNFPGTTNSNSTGARVYYIVPKRVEKKITAIDENHLSLVHPTGVELNFDKNGKISSPDLAINVSKEINSRNKSGVEIKSYSKGLVIDLGYRMGNSPTTNKNGIVTVTDKNSKKCSFSNSEFHNITKYDSSLKYKTNESLHTFLSKKCPQLDLSDLLAPMADSLKNLNKAAVLGSAPKKDEEIDSQDSKREAKPKYENIESLINDLDKNEAGAKSK
ncbi:MAG: hypothetical protein WC635_01385 [Bacteriovorax sp.]